MKAIHLLFHTSHSTHLRFPNTQFQSSLFRSPQIRFLVPIGPRRSSRYRALFVRRARGTREAAEAMLPRHQKG